MGIAEQIGRAPAGSALMVDSKEVGVSKARASSAEVKDRVNCSWSKHCWNAAGYHGLISWQQVMKFHRICLTCNLLQSQ